MSQYTRWPVISGGGGGGGSVTSVALAAATILQVTGSPITSSGTITLSFADQAAGAVLAGPISGPATTPAFRALVASDTPQVLALAGGTMTGALTLSGAPTLALHAATKQYVDTAAAGYKWQYPVVEPHLVGDDLNLPPGSPVTSTAYIVGAAPAGAWSAFSPGSLVQWSGSSWVLLLSYPVPLGATFGVNFENIGTLSGGLVGKQDALVKITGNTPGAITYAVITPEINFAAFVSNPASNDSGESFYFNGSVWVQLSPAVPITLGSGLTSTAAQLSAKTDGVTTGFDGSDNIEVITGDLTEAVSSVLTITGGTGAMVRGNVTIEAKQVTTSQDGYLSASDFNVFTANLSSANIDGGAPDSVYGGISVINGGTP